MVSEKFDNAINTSDTDINLIAKFYVFTFCELIATLARADKIWQLLNKLI